MERRPEKISSLEVDRGLYLLRYSGAAVADSPVIYARPSPGSEELITIIAVPGEMAGRLEAPGSVAVVVVEEDATLQITARAMSAGGSLQAEVRLEPLHQPAQPAVLPASSIAAPTTAGVAAVPRQIVAASARPLSGPASESVKDFSILAHVSRRGDVVGEEGVWIGGPDAPAPIEGLSLDCSAECGVVQYQVLIAGEGRWSDWLSAGSFGGSRGRARPLTGLRIRFAPASGQEMSIEGEALFLGSAVVRKEGLEMEFRSAAGLDPLVGFRVGIRRALPAVTKPSAVATGAPSGRVRVFKASSGRRSG